MKREYLINCELGLARSADYKTMEAVRSLFEFTTEETDGCGNLCSDVVFDLNTGKAKFVQFPKRDDTKHLPLYRTLPSALLMYRLACTFAGTASFEGQDGYKFVWQFRLKHKASGEFVTFGEWKGGSLFWTSGENSKEFKRDLLKLLTYLASENCAHPYDGLVAGSVA